MQAASPTMATHSFEIEVSLSGSYSPGCPAWGGSRFEPPINPPEDARIDDIDIEDIGVISASRKDGRIVWTTTSILKGVDRKSEAYRQIVSNLLEMIEAEATEALFERAA